MKITITKDFYLINFKYPVIARYTCYECPGAYYIDWRECHLFKYKTKITKRRATKHEELMIQMSKATEYFYNKMQERWLENNSFWG